MPNHTGKPCKTPMGFADIETMASHIKTGQHLFNVLHGFCGNTYSPLRKQCAIFNCLLPTPPKTLGDMFAFYYNFLGDWNRNDKRKKHREEPFEQAVKGVNFENPDTDLDITSVFKSTKHSSGKNTPHHDGDLHSLVSCNPTSTAAHPCGPYLRPLSSDLGTMLSKKNADKYLSWIVYVTETFYDLLKKLFDECNKQCGGDKPKCRIANCPTTCTVAKQPTKLNHSDPCKSLVNCKTTLPTLCSYGFTIENPSKLSGIEGASLKRTCNDLCKILETVCHGRSVLADMVVNKIPQFLWEIRKKFSYLLLALWSLSLLYLLHIAVVRLDVLRIRSHLRSPSSHRIAAQSLLAAARVKALANVKYFSP
ncbi:hypothetical protein, conserved [Babesia ovata]|uniref:Uncharacterized protein n=1 Tax=Babesia ovata TaxID=189622 RepID=A0A2H6KJX8_9APIC|nr:uncharacterized protein BOVATA_047850 [Babesia ovata]GBE63292.1 hypothetical protein, conserved [Babesia ovata]